MAAEPTSKLTPLGRVGTGFTSAAALTPQQYADAVSNHARQTVETSPYPGPNFDKLSQYLQQDFPPNPGVRPSSRSARSRSPVDTERFHFLTAYGCDAQDGSFKKLGEYDDPESCPSAGTEPMVLFLRGKPSSRWISSLGAAFKLDPEFFNRHLDFRSTLGRTNYFSLPSLPSAQSMLFDLPYITIGQVRGDHRPTNQSLVNSMRTRCSQQFDAYWESIGKMFDHNNGLGHSLVREFRLHDHVHFSLEQRISVLLSRNINQSTWQLIIWLDTGRSLSQSPQDAPWLGSLMDQSQSSRGLKVTLNPVIRVQQSVALRPNVHIGRPKASKDADQDVLAQNACFLHSDYGSRLERLEPSEAAVAIADPFYVLYDVFQFVAVSFKQYLNMLEVKDRQRTMLGLQAEESSPNLLDQEPEQFNSTNLRYDQSALESHLPQLRAIVEVIKHRGNMGPPALLRHMWPHPPKNSQQEAVAAEAAHSLQNDFEFLVAHAERLQKRYNDGMTLLMNRAVTAEAAKSLKQAREVTKLTRLAFVYIPLGFTAAFFGMNVREFVNWRGPNSGEPPLWLWFAVSVPVLLINLAFMQWNMTEVGERAVAWVHERPWRRRGRPTERELQHELGKMTDG